MNPKAILEKIIQEEGSCTWASATVCNNCPLGKIARGDGKGFMSCVEAINIDGLSEEEADKKYKEAALDKLADLSMENIIDID